MTSDAITMTRRFLIDQRMALSVRLIATSVDVAVRGDRPGRRREPDLVHALGHDVLAGCHPLEDLDPAVRADAEPKRPALERLALDHDVGDRAPGVVDDRGLRDRERAAR